MIGDGIFIILNIYLLKISYLNNNTKTLIAIVQYNLSFLLTLFFWLASINIIVLHLLIPNNLLLLQTEHSNLRTIFLVVLAFFLKIGLVYPPNPAYFMSYLLLP